MTEPEAQAALGGIALELVAIADRLQAIHDALPPSRNREAMLEHRRPYDVATEISGTIECVVADQLRPAIEHLEAASRVTADELRERHREEQALDVATELSGTIECVLEDQLRPAIEHLEAASRVTADELRERHREEQALLRRFRGRI